MKFKTHEDIEAPIDFVFEQVSDFPAFERSIMRRGADIERVRDGGAHGLGAKWAVKFLLRGTERAIEAEVTEAQAPNALKVEMKSRSADGVLQVELVPLSRARTRLNVMVRANAKTIAAKLLFKSARFAKNKTEGRFQTVVEDFAAEVDQRYRA